ncbi:MAG TPA: RluA family pseudouridine synthase [Synergistales bacterium]|nr:RluA family pseudouridine synthase [Synergistales bacterium]
MDGDMDEEETLSLVVGEDLDGERLDVFLTWKLDRTRSQVQALIRDGKVRLEQGQRVRPSMVVRSGMGISVSLEPRPARELIPEPVFFGVVWEDEDILVVDKPSGLIVHPSPGHWKGTLVHGLLDKFPEIAESGAPGRPGIVHRLDASTSGLMVVARNDRSFDTLTRAFQERRVRKEYLALVWGVPKKTLGRIDLPVGRNPRNRYRMAVISSGKSAVTEYSVLWSRSGFSLVRCCLVTGRTHQIRVHMKHIGCPLVGDQLYAPRRKTPHGLDRLFLHSWILGFDHPRNGEPLLFRSFIHQELRSFLGEVLPRGRERL